MKAVFDRKALAETVARVAPLAQSSKVKPILRNILVELGADGTAVFSATNLEQSLRVELSANQGAEPGRCLLSADKFLAILKSCLGDLFELSVEGDRAVMVCGGGKWRLNTESVDEFPAARFGVVGAGREAPATGFIGAVGLAAICCDPTATRYAFGGVKLLAKDQSLTAIGTDGRRAVIVSLPCPGAGVDAILPIAAVRLIERSLLAAGNVRLSSDASHFTVEGAGCAIWTRQLEGRFPTLNEQLRTFESQLEVRLPAQALLAAVQQAVVTTPDDEPAVELQFASGVTRVTSTASAGEAVAEIPVAYAGEAAKWRVRPAYLREFLRAIGDVELTFALGAGRDASTCYPAGWAMLSTDSAKYIVGGLADK